MFTKDQEIAASLTLEGHNVFIDGFAGTGKTYLLKELYRSLKKSGKNVSLTCTTGIACMNYDLDMSACTIHRWSGLHDGRYNSLEVLTVVKNNEQVMERIKATDVLIIDEISMFSQKLFDQLQSICAIKDPTKPWGGIQIIVSGDFNQLPPTPNKDYNDEGNFCFRSTHFKRLHKITLTTVVRQNEEQLVGLIKNVSQGVISEDNEMYITSLERPLAVLNTVKLFAKNDLVNRHNRKEILNSPGTMYEYKSIDSGDPTKLRNVRAQETLWLKENCPVILIRNLSQTLVNGLQGTIIKCEPDGPTVHFPKVDCTMKMKRISFSVFSARQNRTLASRDQIPLLLSYALTIHKAQGMTLDSVEVDCREIFQPGQLGVAIGRVRTSQGLRVINFSPKICFQQPEEIRLFKAEPPITVLEDLSCCRHTDREETVESVEDFWFDDDFSSEDVQEEDFDEHFNEILAQLDLGDSAETVQIPEDFDVQKVLNDCVSESPVTPIQSEVNQIVNNILEGDLQNCKKFCSQQFRNISNIVNDMGITENVAVKAEKLNKFYAECHKYQTSDSYKLACMLFLQNFPAVSHAHSHVCTQITNSVRHYLLKEKASIFKVSERDISNRKITDAAKARIRYVGGYCVHEVRKKYSSLHKSVMYSSSVEGQSNFQIAEERLNVLNSVIEREDILKATTTDPHSLIDIERRQNISHGLLNISDDMYLFFCEACSIAIQILIDKNLNVHGEQLHSFCLKELLNNTVLYEEFVQTISKNLIHFQEFVTSASLQSSESVVAAVLSETVSNVQHATDLYKEIIEKFLLVMLSQFRKDLLDSFSVAKTMAHRKQIQARKQKQSLATKNVSFESVMSDKTPHKEMSHSLLKGMLLSNSDFFKTMNKKNILKLCDAYNVTFKPNELKSVLSDKLKKAIVSSSEMPNYKVLISDSESETSKSLDIREISTHSALAVDPQPGTSGVSSATPSGTLEIEPDTSTVITDIEEQTSGTIPPGAELQPTQVDQESEELSTSGFAQLVNEPEVEMEEDTDSDLCDKCKKTGKEGIQWIQCSSCKKWFHRNCAGLRAKKKWEKFSKENVDFFCPECA